LPDWCTKGCFDKYLIVRYKIEKPRKALGPSWIISAILVVAGMRYRHTICSYDAILACVVDYSRLAKSTTLHSRPDGMPVSRIASLVQRQASFVSYLDVLRAVGMLTLVVWLFVLFVRAARPTGCIRSP
jgi:hypothetical protein